MSLFLYAITICIFKSAPSPVHIYPVHDQRETIVDVVQSTNPVEGQQEMHDDIIKRFRAWEDYDGNRYEGYYTVLRSSFDRSHKYKSDYNFASQELSGYDNLVHNLKEHDTNGLKGFFKMLDSIQVSNHMGKAKFAETVVTLVQDIPYSLVLERECSGSQYSDPFIRQWLEKPSAICDPFERFGINSPVEFITNLKGDCDTRTLLLYSVLEHYGYDVVLLSSEFYSHSLLGINLPYEGAAFYYNDSRYAMWETTSPGVRPGIISPQMADTKHWRISLKTKIK
ncbi:MAG: hypothetical protein EOP48_13840 [Sphingobacteriales bacterium]|nr:MAG: hypothetical protein EOP48_13840 [Sphingobacteriales bacterium]